MYSKALFVALFCFGLNLISCTSNIEDVAFLNNAVERYSPVLIKDLLMERINHKMEQIQVANSSIGVNQKQVDLCNVVHEGFAVLLSDLELMEESQIIQGDDTYDKTIKSYITEFATLTETFNREFEFLKLPDLTRDTPDALLEMKFVDTSTFNTIKYSLLTSVRTYKRDIENYIANAKKGPKKFLAQATVRKLEDTYNKANALIYDYLSKAKLHDILIEFKQTVDMFYRQI